MSKKSEIGEYVNHKIHGIIANEYGAGAVLAELRKGVGKTPGEMPSLFGSLLEGMPEDFLSRNNEPTREEWSCYISLTLYASHQQGRDPSKSCVHTDEWVSVGYAANQLKKSLGDTNAEERILQKLRQIITAQDIKGCSWHLRSFIHLLADAGIKLNYALLAKDLFDWQNPEKRNNISLKWGQDFYRTIKEESKDE